MESVTVPTPAAVRLPRFPSLRALAALLVLSLRQQIRGWRLVVVGLLFLLPSALAMLVYWTMPVPSDGTTPAEVLEFNFIFKLIPLALAPLAALLCAGGIIRDDVEEQTLTYVLLRPLPRTAIYAVKLLAAIVTTALLTSLFAAATLVLIALMTGESADAALVRQAATMAAIFSLTQAAYCGLFALMSLLLRRALVMGVLYIFFFEGLLATFDTIARRMTVIYYFRVLVLRWLELFSGAEWTIDLSSAPSAAACVWILLGAGLALAVLGSAIFGICEFRMKTPEGA
jgi:ABC-2 type transport system permease protein